MKQDLMKIFPRQFKGISLLLGEYEIDVDPEATPVQLPARNEPEALRESLTKELNRMMKLGIIFPVTQATKLVHNLVYVLKPSGELWICLDPWLINKHITWHTHYMSNFNDVLMTLAKEKYFSTLDAKAGYWNVKLSEWSSFLTTFNTPFGWFKFKWLPFGLVSSREVFQWRVNSIFEGIPGMFWVSDDIKLQWATELKHDIDILETCDCAKQVGLVFSQDKCSIKQNKINTMVI